MRVPPRGAPVRGGRAKGQTCVNVRRKSICAVQVAVAKHKQLEIISPRYENKSEHARSRTRGDPQHSSSHAPRRGPRTRAWRARISQVRQPSEKFGVIIDVGLHSNPPFLCASHLTSSFSPLSSRPWPGCVGARASKQLSDCCCARALPLSLPLRVWPGVARSRRCFLPRARPSG